ncbi:hypothetical protein DFH06DRAFT_1466960 [Mycena polygramma]|nr:hypothetical protein DFH06DRAFT_1466960 [Mycena polygramma]
MASVDDLRTRRYDLAIALKHHRKVIRDMEKETREVDSQLNALLDPIARLPVELSSDIFLRCLPSTPSSDSDTAPLLLVQICHSWRVIAHSTPALWAAISIESPSRRGSCTPLDSWLNRAQHLPLSLSIRGTLQGEHVVSDLVQRYAHRVQNLELDLLCGDELDQITVPFVALQSLTISQGEDKAPHRYIARGESYYSYSVAECLELMCAAPNLVVCTFLDIFHQADFGDAWHVEEKTHPSLKHLRFGEGSIMAPSFRSSSTIILHHLTLPALESLLVIPGYFKQQDFIEFLTRSSPPLQSLELSPGQYQGWNEAGTAERAFRLIPSLTDLRLSFGSIREAAVLSEPLVLRPLADVTVLPNLRNLSLRGYMPDNPGYDKLLLVLSARRAHAGPKMHSFRLIWDIATLEEQRCQRRMRGDMPSDWKPEAHILTALKALVADGMEIHIGLDGGNLI